MAVYSRAGVVLNGLVLYLDAANKKSYPGTGTTWYDMSGNGYAGSLVNGPVWNSDSGGSIAFDGTNDFISTNYAPGTVSQQTVNCWINKTNTQYSYIVASSTTYFGLEIYPTIVYVNIANNQYGQVSYNINGWQNITFTYDGSQADNTTRLKIYLNGTLQTVAYTGTIPSSTTVPSITIGSRWWTSGYSQGSISNVQIYNRALSAQEVLQNYNTHKSRFGLS